MLPFIIRVPKFRDALAPARAAGVRASAARGLTPHDGVAADHRRGADRSACCRTRAAGRRIGHAPGTTTRTRPGIRIVGVSPGARTPRFAGSGARLQPMQSHGCAYAEFSVRSVVIRSDLRPHSTPLAILAGTCLPLISQARVKPGRRRERTCAMAVGGDVLARAGSSGKHTSRELDAG